jgi:hypothetical protein
MPFDMDKRVRLKVGPRRRRSGAWTEFRGPPRGPSRLALRALLRICWLHPPQDLPQEAFAAAEEAPTVSELLQ